MLVDSEGREIAVGDVVRHKYPPVPVYKKNHEMTPDERRHHWHMFFGELPVTAIIGPCVRVKSHTPGHIPVHLAELVTIVRKLAP
ncbi:MAG: hypothetical protein AB7E70_21635 [Hyphomicrobiaceae bacterium]